MGAIRLTLAPEPGKMGALIEVGTRERSAEARGFREQLGIDGDAPVVMAGHQAAFWHAGTVAKYMSADVAARMSGARVAWLVVDQDENEPLVIRCPTSSNGALEVRDVALGEAQGRGPTGWREPARVIAAEPPDGAPECARRGIGRMHDALRSHEAEPSLARQVARANAALLGELGLSGSIVHSRAMSGTELFASLVGRMKDDPILCARAYNEAAARFPDAGVRALQVGARVELPLWRVADGVRRAVHSDDAGEAGTLVPRALLMTAMMRLAGCDLFVHGTGGAGEDAAGGYEAINDVWLESWLGERPAGRVAVASATVLMELGGADAPTSEAIAEAKARAHKARHEPSIVGDEAAAREKARLLAAIEDAKARGQKPGALFGEMQKLLAAYRERHAEAFEALDAEAARLEARAGEAAIREDRTWAWPLHDERRVRGLKAEIDRAFGFQS